MSGMNFLEKLLDGVAVEWKTLGEVCLSISAGGDLPAKYLKGQNEPTEEFSYPIYSNGIDEKSIYGYTDGYKVDAEAVTISARGTIGWHTVRQAKFTPIVRLVVLIPNTSSVTVKFLNYVLDVTEIGHSGGSIPQLTVPNVKKILIPIPPLKIQAEIVRILDTFTALTAELTDRKKQYNYYRDRLLSFEECEVEWKPLGEIGEFIRGKRFTKADYVDDGIQAIHYGEIYTHYGVSASHTLSQVRTEMAASLRYAIPGDVVMAGVGETVEDVGKAVAWIGSEKVAIHDDSWAFRHSINPEFVSYVMQTARFINEKTKHVSSGKVERLLISGIEKVRIPIPYPNDFKKSVAEQARIVAILDKFDILTHSISEGLPREIALRQKQYEYYRDLLLTFPKPEEVEAHLSIMEKLHE
jgi:type I restriction enzyme, S subunit